ncbi:MAG TPA: energy-coupling factor ABC transporter permease [Desulfomonilia bacterium]|jgi:cobalt/nickel transport system permease protein|nr:energy-coupling factor ABC transporter permease [Deltaproteobacteria bacterium]HPD20625.1 energy-coupling factor ABC transporter permease [Deltaproteobacteria bacterium]HRS55555.1 energy-coupling factor ABC transporter permease [Desulfomonilia bacterium]HRV35139.1 energy-coupling factor ABC transporter permease [Desulfomonilia bacterium]
MHMADALISPAVGGAMWAVSAGLIGYCSKKVKEDLDEQKVPLMGVMGAFIFAAQMINFTIPATGSSGHLGGGLILAILLGPYAAFLVISSVLVVQALFFADGGLLALGCNIFNLGFFPAFVAYPLIYKKIVKDSASPGRILTGSLLAAIIGLQLGAFGVVLETLCSGITSLPFTTFVALMQPIHLGIGIVEGLVTAAVVSFVWKANPEILDLKASTAPSPIMHARQVAIVLLVAAAFTGGFVSWFASEHPDGLEWAIEKVTGKEELENAYNIQDALAQLQEKSAFLPDYSLKVSEAAAAQPGQDQDPRLGTSVSGIVGGFFTLCLAVLVGFALKKRSAGSW